MNRIIYLLFIVELLFCSACTHKNERKKKLEAELRQFKENVIILPDNMLAKNCDKSMLPDTTLLRRSLKMVVYINRYGCTDCKLRALLPIYMFSREYKNLKNFGVIIILNTPNIEATEQILAEMRFRQTVFYDLDSSFERHNPHLPKNEQFHTFLLDEKNKVILVGNPVYNVAIKDLYLQQLTGERKQTKIILKTSAVVDQPEFDFGLFDKSEVKETIFEIRNTGDNPLVITDISTTCGCTVATYEKNPAKSGERLYVKVRVTPKEIGFFHESVIVKCNTDQNIHLIVRGQVR